MQMLVGAGVPACPAGVEEQACWALLPGAGDSVRSPAQGVCKWGGPEHGRVRMGMRGGGQDRGRPGAVTAGGPGVPATEMVELNRSVVSS